MVKKSYKLISDEELFKLLKTNRRAENEFYRRYKNRVKNILRKYNIQPLDREDLIQEGMIGLFHAIETFDHKKGAKFSTYANVCIKNRILNALSSYWQHRKNIEQDQDIEDIVSTESPENDSIQSEYSDWLKKGVQNLSVLEQKVLEGYLSRKSYKMIAEELEISTKKVDNILVKIRAKLALYAEESQSQSRNRRLQNIERGRK